MTIGYPGGALLTWALALDSDIGWTVAGRMVNYACLPEMAGCQTKASGHQFLSLRQHGVAQPPHVRARNQFLPEALRYSLFGIAHAPSTLSAIFP